jgi:hypothetical protein
MNGAEFARTIIEEMHGAMMADVKDLTQEQLAWKPAPGTNPIGFLFWHYVRTEDNMIHSLTGKSSVWQVEKWCEKLGMDPDAQGTGFHEPDVDKAASLPLSETLAYAEKVFTETSDYLNSLDDAGLDYAPNPERPRRNVGMMLRNFVVAHGWWHLGEIKYVKGMQGMSAAR